MTNFELLEDEDSSTITVETITYPEDVNGVKRIVTRTTTNSKKDSSHNEEKSSKYIDDQHKILIENNKSQEKLILQFSVLLIGSTLTFSKLMEVTPLDFFTLIGIYTFILAIILATISYSVAQYVCRKSMDDSTKYYDDTTDTVPYPDITKYTSEKIRRFLDYCTAGVFCVALPLTFYGISKQYENFQKITKEEVMSSKDKNDSNRSIDPKPAPKKPENKPITPTKDQSNKGKN